MKHHVNKIASACFYHIRRLRQIRHYVSRRVLKQLVTSLVLSRLDYCNAILAGLPALTLMALQREQNSAAPLVLGLDRRSSTTTALRDTVAAGPAPHHLQSRNSDAPVAVHRNRPISSRSAQPTHNGSSASLRPEQPRYRELGPSSEDEPFLSAVLTCGTVFLHLSTTSTPTRPSVVLSKLICSS